MKIKIELKSRSSLTINVGKKAGKTLLLYVVGVIISIFIWVWVISTYANPSEQTDPEYVGIVFFLAILVIETIITVIRLYLIYLNRVVKMHPKSSYPLENMSNYLSEVNKYQNGDYSYETIKSNKDIVESFAKGKVIVFTAIQTREKANIREGTIIIVFTYILLTIIIPLLSNLKGIRIPILMFGYSITFVIIAGPLVIPNLIKLRRIKRSFFILTPEGIVYRRIWGGTRTYSWKELDLKFYLINKIRTADTWTFGPTIYVQFNVVLPNGAELFFIPKNYSHKEFLSYEKTQPNSNQASNLNYPLLSISEKIVIDLIQNAFNLYCDLGKLDLEEKFEVSK